MVGIGFTMISDDRIIIKLSTRIYEKTALFSAAYLLTGRCVVHINPSDENDVEVTFMPMAGHSVDELRMFVDEFSKDIIDQQLRLDLERQYGKLRELIVEHAFAPIADLRSRLTDK